MALVEPGRATRAAPAAFEFGSPAPWLVAAALIMLPLVSNSFFLSEIFGQMLILGIIALSLMFLAGYGGMVSLMQLTVAGIAGYMYAIFGVTGTHSVSLDWPWWLATPMALALATLFGTIGGALAVRTEGIYTIMITLALGVLLFHQPELRDLQRSHRHQHDLDASLLGRRLARAAAVLLSDARRGWLMLFRGRLSCAGAVWVGVARGARQPAPDGGARLSRQRPPRRSLRLRRLYRRAWRRLAGLELPADLARLC
jgi:hypothetical protein